jgi:hypothetical protein
MLDSADGSSSYGRYIGGTNHIMIRDDQPHEEGIVVRDRTESRRRLTILHEQLHYAAWLGGGMDIRWRDGEGHPVIAGRVGWLHEGLTEMHAQQIVRSHGHQPGYVSYPHETATGIYLQRLVGADTLRRAYLTGDFTQVRQALDRRLGAGTFDRLLQKRNGAEALSFLMGRMEAAGVRRTGWDRDAVIVDTGVLR